MKYIKMNIVCKWLCIALMICNQTIVGFTLDDNTTSVDTTAVDTAVDTETVILETVLDNIDEDENVSNIVYNQTELEAWLLNPTGAELVFGANIEINNYAHLYFADEVIINTGEYGFIINNDMTIVGNVTIIGKGSVVPVITVCDGGILTLTGQSGLITVTSTDENGNTLYIKEGGAYLATTPACFFSNGDHGIAIKSESPLELYHHQIEANGIGGSAITSSALVSLRLCNVKAEGVSVDAPEVILDTCTVLPSVLNAQVITRKLSNIKMQFSQAKFLNINETEGIFNNKYRCFLILSSEGQDDISETVYLQFVDTGTVMDKAGEYKIPATIQDSLIDIYSFIDSKEIYLNMIVYEPSVPFFYNYKNIDGEHYFYYRYEGESLEPLTLWKSYDEGESWKTCWDNNSDGDKYPKISWDGMMLEAVFSEDAFANPAVLVFEVKDQEYAYALFVDIEKGNLFSCANGGDRVGGDRFILPWLSPSPKPTPKPENDSPTNTIRKNKSGNIYVFSSPTPIPTATPTPSLAPLPTPTPPLETPPPTDVVEEIKTPEPTKKVFGLVASASSPIESENTTDKKTENKKSYKKDSSTTAPKVTKTDDSKNEIPKDKVISNTENTSSEEPLSKEKTLTEEGTKNPVPKTELIIIGASMLLLAICMLFYIRRKKKD